MAGVDAEAAAGAAELGVFLSVCLSVFLSVFECYFDCFFEYFYFHNSKVSLLPLRMKVAIFSLLRTS